ncbi:MAG: DsbA family protein [Candidatus Micrarchaeia archaeon]
MENKIKKAKSVKADSNEPKILVKPIGRFGGLDSIHVALIIVVALLIALLLVVSYQKPAIKVVANTTAKPIHNSTQVLASLQRFLASYAYVNSSLSVLPYVTEIQNASIAYLPSSRQWLAEIPAVNPATNTTFEMGFLVNDSNTSKILPLIQAAAPSKILNNSEVYQGVIKLSDKYACNVEKPLQVYWFIDPYEQGSVKSLMNATQLESRFGNNISIQIKIFNTQATMSVAKQYGLVNAELLGKYIFCASSQAGFENFVRNLNAAYTGSFMGTLALNNIVNESGLNYTALASCINTSQQAINNQALLAQFYNITTTPAVIVDCEYMSIPQTAEQAICFANSTLCK